MYLRKKPNMYMVSTEGQAQLPDYRIVARVVHIMLHGQFSLLCTCLVLIFVRNKGKQQLYYLRYKKGEQCLFSICESGPISVKVEPPV